MRSTGPVLAIGAITVVNQVGFQENPIDWRVPIATGMAAMLFGLAEKAAGDVIVDLAYLALVASLFVPIGDNPAPIEVAAAYFGFGPHKIVKKF
jgi:hypothetical protein